MELESEFKISFGFICKYANWIYVAVVVIKVEQFTDDNDYYWQILLD
jgi:hypothetical protein